MKLKNKIALIAGTGLLTIAGAVMAQKETKMPAITVPTFGKGLTFAAADSTFKITMHGRFQTLLTLDKTLDDGATYADAKIFTRRARLKFNGFAFNPNVTYKMELGLTNRDWGSAKPETNNAPNMILDAVLKWKFAPGFQVWIGQTKLPSNRERVISSQQLQFVDRSMVNSKFNLDRDRGIQLRHTFKLGKAVIREIASISSGEGRNVTIANTGGFAYTGRVEVLPMGKFTSKGDYFGSDLARESSPKLSVGINYDYNDDTNRERGQLGSFTTSKTDLESWMLDIMYKYNGFSLMSEMVHKTSPQSEFANGDSFYTGRGLSLQAGYLLKSNWELAGRYTVVSPFSINVDAVTGATSTTFGNQVEQYTLGLSRYVVGHSLKVQTDITLQVTENNPTEELVYRFQVEMAF